MGPPPTPGTEFTLESPLRPDIVDISSLISVLMGFLFPIATLVFFIMVLYAGFMFMSAKGDVQKVAKAQSVIISALIGFILLVIAFFIVRIVGYIFGFTGGILPS